jgi:hypothetical protein
MNGTPEARMYAVALIASLIILTEQQREIWRRANKKYKDARKDREKQRLAKWSKANREKRNATQREYTKRHKEEIAIKSKQHYLLHQEEIAVYQKKYRDINKESIAAYLLAHKGHIKERDKKKYEKDKDKYTGKHPLGKNHTKGVFIKGKETLVLSR